MNKSIFSALILLSFVAFSFATEPSQSDVTWDNTDTVISVFTGDFNTAHGQGMLYISCKSGSQTIQYAMDLNTEYGQLSYYTALTALIRGNYVNILRDNTPFTDDTAHNIKQYHCYRIVIRKLGY